MNSSNILTDNPIAPDGSRHHALTLSIAVPSVEGSLEFYANAFGATEIYRAPNAGGRLQHAQMRIGDTLFFIARAAPGEPRNYQAPADLQGTTCAIYMYVVDCRGVLQRAVDAGASALSAVTTRPWGDEDALVRDPYGHLWAIASRRG